MNISDMKEFFFLTVHSSEEVGHKLNSRHIKLNEYFSLVSRLRLTFILFLRYFPPTDFQDLDEDSTIKAMTTLHISF